MIVNERAENLIKYLSNNIIVKSSFSHKNSSITSSMSEVRDRMITKEEIKDEVEFLSTCLSQSEISQVELGQLFVSKMNSLYSQTQLLYNELNNSVGLEKYRNVEFAFLCAICWCYEAKEESTVLMFAFRKFLSYSGSPYEYEVCLSLKYAISKISVPILLPMMEVLVFERSLTDAIYWTMLFSCNLITNEKKFKSIFKTNQIIARINKSDHSELVSPMKKYNITNLINEDNFTCHPVVDQLFEFLEKANERSSYSILRSLYYHPYTPSYIRLCLILKSIKIMNNCEETCHVFFNEWFWNFIKDSHTMHNIDKLFKDQIVCVSSLKINKNTKNQNLKPSGVFIKNWFNKVISSVEELHETNQNSLYIFDFIAISFYKTHALSMLQHTHSLWLILKPLFRRLTINGWKSILKLIKNSLQHLIQQYLDEKLLTVITEIKHNIIFIGKLLTVMEFVKSDSIYLKFLKLLISVHFKTNSIPQISEDFFSYFMNILKYYDSSQYPTLFPSVYEVIKKCMKSLPKAEYSRLKKCRKCFKKAHNILEQENTNSNPLMKKLLYVVFFTYLNNTEKCFEILNSQCCFIQIINEKKTKTNEEEQLVSVIKLLIGLLCKPFRWIRGTCISIFKEFLKELHHYSPISVWNLLYDALTDPETQIRNATDQKLPSQPHSPSHPKHGSIEEPESGIATETSVNKRKRNISEIQQTVDKTTFEAAEDSITSPKKIKKGNVKYVKKKVVPSHTAEVENEMINIDIDLNNATEEQLIEFSKFMERQSQLSLFMSGKTQKTNPKNTFVSEFRDRICSLIGCICDVKMGGKDKITIIFQTLSYISEFSREESRAPLIDRLCDHVINLSSDDIIIKKNYNSFKEIKNDVKDVGSMLGEMRNILPRMKNQKLIRASSEWFVILLKYSCNIYDLKKKYYSKLMFALKQFIIELFEDLVKKRNSKVGVDFFINLVKSTYFPMVLKKSFAETIINYLVDQNSVKIPKLISLTYILCECSTNRSLHHEAGDFYQYLNEKKNILKLISKKSNHKSKKLKENVNRLYQSVKCRLSESLHQTDATSDVHICFHA